MPKSSQALMIEAREKEADELKELLEQFKLVDALSALRGYGVTCVEDLRELEPGELDDLALTPIAKKKLVKLMVHLGVGSFVQVTLLK